MSPLGFHSKPIERDFWSVQINLGPKNQFIHQLVMLFVLRLTLASNFSSVSQNEKQSMV